MTTDTSDTFATGHARSSEEAITSAASPPCVSSWPVTPSSPDRFTESVTLAGVESIGLLLASW
ncbi:hypothetical protein HMSSN036_58490 [Paenibacillus macerans]|nr:hypothetical protein HMSSN036_58490 [Paenibacillus macerans]